MMNSTGSPRTLDRAGMTTVDVFTSNGPPYSTQFEGSGEPLSIGTRAYSMQEAHRGFRLK